MTDVTNKCRFACNLLTTEYHKQVLEVDITLETSDIPCVTRDVASVMIYLRWQQKITSNCKSIASKLHAMRVRGCTHKYICLHVHTLC